MEFYDKFMYRFHDMSKVKNPTVSKAKAITQNLQKKMIWEKMMLSYVDHALLEGSS